MQRYLTLTLFLAFYPVLLFSQNEPEIGPPEVSYYNDTLKVVYEIGNCKTGNLYEIKLKVFNSQGGEIRASALSGDIGRNITCGTNKTIYWDLAADNIQIDDDIELEILANLMFVDEPVIGRPEKVKEKSGRGKIIASSLIFPGLGQKKASGKKGHLILGAAGYGCVAAAGIMFSESNRAYNRYEEATSQDARDEYFQKSEDLFNTAKAAAIGAGGIWAINLIWSAIIPIEDNKMTFGLGQLPTGGVSINARWNF